MAILWKKTMFIRYMLRICVVLHISSSFHKGAECVLVIKPQDVEAFSGEVVTLTCASSASKRGNIAWITPDPETFIYAKNITASIVSTYITVDDRDNGSCNLNITASVAAAKRYICKELNSGDEAGAELVVIENNAKCTREIKDGSHNVNCSVVSAGKWHPTVVCEVLNEDGELSELPGNQTNNTDNNVVTSLWNFISKKDDYCNLISCSSKLKTRINTDCPRCRLQDTGLGVKLVLTSKENPFWTFAIRCFPDDFKLLLRGYDDATSKLTVIGCSISVIALFFTFIICVRTWKQSGSKHSGLLSSLCLALLIAYMILPTATVLLESKDNCKAAVGCLHYFLLVALFTMLAEGEYLLRCVIRNFKDRRPTTYVLLAAAWVTPIMFVITPLLVSQVHGIDNGLGCWLSVDDSFIWSYFVPVLLIVTADIFVLGSVLVMLFWKISILPTCKACNEDNIYKIRSALWNISITCPLLGFASFFGVLYSFHRSVLFLHLFVVASSLQGPLIFIFHGIFNNKKMYAKLHCGSLLSKDTADTGACREHDSIAHEG